MSERISHVLIFSGEMPEVALCTSIEDVKKRVSEAFQFNDEQRGLFDLDLADDDCWTYDESGERFHFSTPIGEIETVTVYAVKDQASPSKSCAYCGKHVELNIDRACSDCERLQRDERTIAK